MSLADDKLTHRVVAPQWQLGPWTRAFFYILAVGAAYYFIRIDQLIVTPYLDFDRYLAGTERLPFQDRILPSLLLHVMLHIPVSARILAARQGAFAQPKYIFQSFIDLVSFIIAGLFTVKLQRAVAPRARLWMLCFPIFLFAMAWSYILHTENRFYYPYDMLSVAFFSVGLYCIYTRRFVALAAIIFFGTLNRETTLFLVAIFVLDALAPIPSLANLIQRLHALPSSRLILARTLLLLALWASVKFTLGQIFRNNDHTDVFLRLQYNLRYLPPKNWPFLFSGCGFLLPIVWLLRRRIPDPRFATYIYILPLWFLTMCVYGELIETRIYGELCPIVAVACTLLIEAYSRGDSGFACDIT